MDRFVSALGPDQKPVGPDVRYHQSTPTYLAAFAAKQSLERTQFADEPDYEIVIYRVSYDGVRFYSSRQVDEKNQGNEKHVSEPEGLEAIAFDLFSAPTSLTSSARASATEQSELSRQ